MSEHKRSVPVPLAMRNGDAIVKFYHAIPLGYLPRLLVSGALYAASVLAAEASIDSPVPAGIRPRKSAARDRRLGLADYVHLSTTACSPLLAHNLNRGDSHALIEFDAAEVLSLPEIALLPYNTKAWRTRACFVPVIDRAERDALLRRHLKTGRLPSLEILVKYGLPLTPTTRVVFQRDIEREAAVRWAEPAARTVRFVTRPELFEPMRSSSSPPRRMLSTPSNTHLPDAP